MQYFLYMNEWRLYLPLCMKPHICIHNQLFSSTQMGVWGIECDEGGEGQMNFHL